MRITEGLKVARAQRQNQTTASQLAEATRVASSGVRVEKPSDDPVAYAAAAASRSRATLLEGRKTAVERASSDMEQSEGVLATAGDLLIRVREIAVQGANGNYGAEQRAAMAVEVAAIREDLIGLANTRSNRGYLFAGTAVTTAPVTAAGAFVGNTDNVDIELADGVMATTNASGARAFTLAGGTDVFAELNALHTALTANNAAGVVAALDKIDDAHRQIVGVRSEVGLNLERARSAGSIIDGVMVTLQGAASKEADADPVEAYSALVTAKNAYERSLEVTRQILGLQLPLPR